MITISKSKTIAENQANQLAEAIAMQSSSMVSQVLNDSLNSAKSLANSIEVIVNNKVEDRELIIDMVKSMLEENQEMFGAFVGFEPNAFDNKDMEYVNKQYHDDTGRLIPYLYREENEIKYRTLDSYNKEGANEYYINPLTTKKRIYY